MKNKTILFHILAKDKGKMLEHWLKTQVEDILYPKELVSLYIRTNDNNDNTQEILDEWVEKQLDREWADITYDKSSVNKEIKQYGVHEWNPVRFKTLGKLRQEGVEYAEKMGYDFYYVQDVDNFVKPYTLGKLASYNLPVVAPLIRYAEGKEEHRPYANYHNIASPNGYYMDNYAYYHILNGHVKGLIKCDVVHCTYLISQSVYHKIKYVDGTDDYEYVIFSRYLRERNVPQYLDNTELYGYLTLDEDLDAVKKWMAKI